MLKGNKIYLRAIEESDLSILRDWRNNEDFRKYFREYKELNMNNQKQWFDKFVVNDIKTLMLMIIDAKTDKKIGVCGLCYINWIHRYADLSMYIGDKSLYVDIEKNGFAWETMDLLFDYAFNRLALHKVWCEIYDFDIKKKKLFDNYGMHQDGILRDNYFYDGKYMNSYLYSILAHEWREGSKRR